MIDPIEFGQKIVVLIKAALAPLLDDIQLLKSKTENIEIDEAQLSEIVAREIKKYVAENPIKGEKGDAGKDGLDIKDFFRADGNTLVATMTDGTIKTLWKIDDPQMTAIVGREIERYAAANPIKGEKGDAGRDGLDVKDFFRAEGNCLVATMSDGTIRNLGKFVGADGKDGRDGKDGLGMPEFIREYDPNTHEIIERWESGGIKKELRYTAGGIHHGGYWREGIKCLAGQTWTHGGTVWIAKTTTTEKPGRDNAAWEIFASKGRDGKDGRDGKIIAPIKLDDPHA